MNVPLKHFLFFRTPMMDLLVQITTAHRINPGGHVIQVMNERSDDFLYYKPSTPIGQLIFSIIFWGCPSTTSPLIWRDIDVEVFFRGGQKHPLECEKKVQGVKLGVEGVSRG